VAVLDSAALAIMGIPLVVLWGVLSFITNFIPNIGFIIGLVPPALLALLTGGWQLAVAVIVVHCVLNMVVQSLIQPRFVDGSVGLSTTVTFVALLFWAWVLGPLGALLAIPMTLLVKAVLVDSDPRARWVEALLGAGPIPARSDTTSTSGTTRSPSPTKARFPNHLDETPQPVGRVALPSDGFGRQRVGAVCRRAAPIERALLHDPESWRAWPPPIP
jgi:hypothetical protein